MPGTLSSTLSCTILFLAADSANIAVAGWSLFFFKDHPDYLALAEDSATLTVSKSDGKDQKVKVIEIENDADDCDYCS